MTRYYSSYYSRIHLLPKLPVTLVWCHRITGSLQYGRGPEKVLVYEALRVRDGQAVTLTTRSRNTADYLQLLEAIAAANPVGEVRVITDNFASHKRPPIRAWLADGPRIR